MPLYADLQKSQLKGTITGVNKAMKSKNAPSLFSLNTLQKIAFKKFGYGTDKTTKIAQSLYEKGVMSYPRTDSSHIGESEYEYLKDLVNDFKELLHADFETVFRPLKKHIDASKVSDHYALIPTKKIANLDSLSTEERNLYLEVVKSVTAIFMTAYEYEETKIITTINEVEFYTTGKIEKTTGWKALLEDKKSKDTILPSVTEGEQVDGKLITSEGKTQPPKSYNEADLIELMQYAGRTLDDEEFSEEREVLSEIEGIGTAATRSEIISKLFKNGYLDTNNKKKVYVTDIGASICKLVDGTSLASPVITADWEKKLKEIENGKKKGVDFIMAIEKEIEEINEKIEENLEQTDFKTNDEEAPICPKCKKGKVVNKGKMYGCTEYQETGCNFSIFKTVAKKTLSEKQILSLIEKGQTDVIKGFKSKSGKDFSAFLTLNAEGKIEFAFPENAKCPKCQKGEIVDKGKLVGCTQYRETGCDFSIFKTIAKKGLSEKQLENLVNKGKTGKIKGFVSKSGKKFDAKLILNQDYKVEFDFS